uniref:Putative secreted protein n=1 Tax=Anopheles marajoara TaxID=58244 RepID=A0A2M4CE33_9DIPT
MWRLFFFRGWSPPSLCFNQTHSVKYVAIDGGSELNSASQRKAIEEGIDRFHGELWVPNCWVSLSICRCGWG